MEHNRYFVFWCC